MQTIAALDLITTTVMPSQKVGDINDLGQPFGPRAVAVLDEGRAIGIVYTRGLQHVDPEKTIEEIMEPVKLYVDGQAPVRRVAAEFLNKDLDAAVVVKGSRFLGVVTTSILLREVGRSWDPLTGLGWSDRLREWGVARLREGREITVIFVDLDKFGQYNKIYGHVVGDYVLQQIARELSERCEDGRDVLVRYGGDEFAIGTLMTRAQADELAAKIEQEVGSVTVGGKPHRISFSVGVFGGRRTHERDHTHYAATMDALINRASQECTTRKNSKLRLTDK